MPRNQDSWKENSQGLPERDGLFWQLPPRIHPEPVSRQDLTFGGDRKRDVGVGYTSVDRAHLLCVPEEQGTGRPSGDALVREAGSVLWGGRNSA